jgi:steroid delta-isomerase-like uncharacterized protein
MNNESNKKLIQRYYQEVLTRGNLEVVDEIYADIIKIGGEMSLSREQFKTYAQVARGAFPDQIVNIQDQIAEGDKVVTRWTAKGTHQGDFLGLPPTGKQVTIKAIQIHQVIDGRIIAIWEEIDMLGLRKQLGLSS